MSAGENIAVVGTGAFAEAVAEAVHRGAPGTLAGLVAPGEALPVGTQAVLSVAPPQQRLAVVEQAAGAGLSIATLPLPEAGDRALQAVQSGHVTQVSPLAGFAALDRLRREVEQGALGRRYAVFAAHRVRQGAADLFDAVGVPLLHYAFTVSGGSAVRAQVTRASLFGGDGDAWFVIVTAVDGTRATVEFAASLPPSAPADEQILVEATGSDAVLRAEPTRQVVTVSARDGSTRDYGWWADLAPGFVTASLDAARNPQPEREVAWLRLIESVRASAETGEPVVAGP